MAKDFVGTEINVGDTVVFTALHYRNLTKGTVDSITPQTVNILPSIKRYSGNGKVRQFHNQVIVIDSVRFGNIINAPIE